MTGLQYHERLAERQNTKHGTQRNEPEMRRAGPMRVFLDNEKRCNAAEKQLLLSKKVRDVTQKKTF